jgi:hypothetical protein
MIGLRPPFNPIFATVVVRRGVGREGKCGRKRKAYRVSMAEAKDQKTKGFDSHKDYKEVVNNVLAFAVKCDQYVRFAATEARTTLL